MTVDWDRRLRWVEHNRRRRESVVSAGELVRRTAQLLAVEQTSLGRVAERLSEVVDGVFREHCRVASVRGDRVVIHVRPATQVGAMRVRWSGVLIEALRGSGPRRVEFVAGEAGTNIP